MDTALNITNPTCEIPTTSRTVRDYVVDDYRTAAVFQKYGLDFCCGGGVAIERACEKKGVSLSRLLRDIATITATPARSNSRYSSWSPTLLISYIIENHHAWVRSVLPTIREHTAKVARVHGGANPALEMIDSLFCDLADDLLVHMEQEEEVLFPAIVKAESGEIRGEELRGVIEKMEEDHGKAGETMRRIRSLSNDFTPPEDACMTYRVLFHELEEFESDLHRHVHLENNLLFPKVGAEAS